MHIPHAIMLIFTVICGANLFNHGWRFARYLLMNDFWRPNMPWANHRTERIWWKCWTISIVNGITMRNSLFFSFISMCKEIHQVCDTLRRMKLFFLIWTRAYQNCLGHCFRFHVIAGLIYVDVMSWFNWNVNQNVYKSYLAFAYQICAKLGCWILIKTMQILHNINIPICSAEQLTLCTEIKCLYRKSIKSAIMVNAVDKVILIVAILCCALSLAACQNAPEASNSSSDLSEGSCFNRLKCQLKRLIYKLSRQNQCGKPHIAIIQRMLLNGSCIVLIQCIWFRAH